MSITSDLIAMMEVVETRLELPFIEMVYIPPVRAIKPEQGEFGFILLNDGSAGFFYVLLGDTLERLNDDIRANAFAGMNPITLVNGLASSDELDRTFAMAAVNAISQHVFRRANYSLNTAANSMAAMGFSENDHVGMVGFFPSLVERLREKNIRLTVLELREHLLQQDERFEVTMDVQNLQHCNKVLCTASTLLNDSLPDVLKHCAAAERVAIIGPTASCLPDPLFERGVDIIGASTVVEVNTLMERSGDNQSWGNAVQKYVIEHHAYPGYEKLLDRLLSNSP